MKYCVTINNKRYEVEVEKGAASILNTTEITLGVENNKKTADIQAAATTTVPKVIETTKGEAPMEGREVVKAPMAGGITDIKVSVGLRVTEGDALLILEAMKMENEITAHVDGVIADIKVTKGANVSAGDILVVIK